MKIIQKIGILLVTVSLVALVGVVYEHPWDDLNNLTYNDQGHPWGENLAGKYPGSDPGQHSRGELQFDIWQPPAEHPWQDSG